MYKVLHVSDLHYDSKEKTNGRVDAKVDIGISSSIEKEFFVTLTKYLSNIKENNEKINLFVISGDIINGWDRKAQMQFSQKFIKLIKQQGYDKKDIMVVPGNHDVKKGSSISSEERYLEFTESWSGCSLPYLDGVYTSCDISIDEKNKIMFIPINTANWSQVNIDINESMKTLIDRIDDPILQKEFRNQLIYDAAFVSPEQISNLEEEIKSIDGYENYMKVMVQHHHLVSVDDSIEVKEMGDILNSEDLKYFIKKYNIKVLLHGHKHVEKAFYEYLNKNENPYKLLISSASNITKSSFFQVLEFSNYNLQISKYDRLGNSTKAGEFIICDTIETNSTIVIEDNNITKLYNKVIAICENKANINKQFICNFNLDGYKEKEYPSPLMYPNDTKEQTRYKKEIEKHVDWWQQDRTMFEDIAELHGPRLKKYNGYINQLEYIYKQLKNSSTTTRTVAVLLEPAKDFHDKLNYPSFISCQFMIRVEGVHEYLDIVANFRKQEMRYWWALNIAELYKLIYEMNKKLNNKFTLGKITTISNNTIYAKEKAFGRSYVSSIDYYMDLDPANVMHQAHSIMCNKLTFNSIEELESTEFVKLLNEIFNDFFEFVKAKDNEDGNSRPRIGIKKLAEFIKKAKNDKCDFQTNFYKALDVLANYAQQFGSDATFQENLKTFEDQLKVTVKCYDELKQSLIK